MSINDRLPKLADFPDQEFRFLTEPTPSLRERALSMADIALGVALDAWFCACPPWIDCDHVDHMKADKWLVRGRKLTGANDAALMKVLSAPVDRLWPVVDTLVIGADGVVRP